MRITDYKTLVVLFEPRQGGNHMSNMLSTSPKIQNRVDVANYRDYLLTNYRNMSGRAHFSELQNVEVHNSNRLVAAIQASALPTVVCGHISESYYVFDLIRQQGPVAVFNFENYNLHDCILHRMNISRSQHYITNLLEWSHRADVVSATFDIDASDMYNIETNWLFRDDISQLLTQIDTDLDLELDLDFCQELHKIWIKKVKVI